MTQEPAKTSHGHPGSATMHNVDHALKELAKTVTKENIKSLALPRLATGYGGLEWEDVKSHVYNRLGDLDIPIYVYTEFHHGVKADEK